MKQIKIILRNILSNKILNSFILGSLVYITFITTSLLPAYSLYSWMILPILIMLFYKSNLYDKNTYKASLIFSIIFAFIMIIGEKVYALQDVNNVSIWDSMFNIRNLVILLGNTSIIYLILTNMIPFLVEKNLNNKKQSKNKISNKKVLFAAFITILICWLPYYLALFPGTISPDSISELTMITNNFQTMSDHHPILHVLFMSIPYTIGLKIFDSANIALAITSSLQSIIMALIFAYSILFLYKKNINKYCILIILACYALFPMHGFYSMVMWKDVLFAGSFLLLTIECMKLLQDYQNNIIQKKTLITFTIVSILCVFLRNNAFYMYIFLTPITLILMRKHLKKILIPFIIVFVIYISVKGPIFNALEIKKSASSEYIGMPMQQIGRMAFKGVDFTKEQEKLLNELMPIEKMKEEYNPRVSDGIKFSKHYNIEVFNKNKLDYAKLWLELIIEYPKIAIEAYLNSTLGYWYPNVQYWSVANNVWENDLGISEEPIVSEKIKEKILNIENRNVPIITIIWSIGLWFWLFAILVYVAIKKGTFINVYPFIPSIGIWITMMVASPVFGEFRYVYCVISTIPVLFVYTLNIDKKPKR